MPNLNLQAFIVSFAFLSAEVTTSCHISFVLQRVVPLGFGNSGTFGPLTAVVDQQVRATESQLPLAV